MPTHHAIQISNQEACLVFSINNAGALYCISTYGKTVGTYDVIYAALQRVAGVYKLSNKDPDDHEAIHAAMGTTMALMADETKTHTTHFHWVCNENMGSDTFGGLLQTLMKEKVINKQQMIASFGYVTA